MFISSKLANIIRRCTVLLRPHDEPLLSRVKPEDTLLRKVLYILGLLTMKTSIGSRTQALRESLKPGEVVVEEGGQFEHLFIVLEGKLSISIRGSEVAEIGQGEVVGEISLLDSRPPSATATASTQSLLLAIPLSAINSQLNSDSGFAARSFVL